VLVGAATATTEATAAPEPEIVNQGSGGDVEGFVSSVSSAQDGHNHKTGGRGGGGGREGIGGMNSSTLRQRNHSSPSKFNLTDIEELRIAVTENGWHPGPVTNEYKHTTVTHNFSVPVLTFNKTGGADWNKFHSFVTARSPVVLRSDTGDLADILGWRTKLWTKQYLAEKAGFVDIVVDSKDHTQQRFGTANTQWIRSFGDFLTDLESPFPAKYLGLRADVQAYKPPLDILQADIPAPAYFRQFNKKLYHANLWMGGRQDLSNDTAFVQTPFNPSVAMCHGDVNHDNINVILKGKKEFTLFSPADAPNLYTLAHITSVGPEGQVNFGKQKDMVKHVSFNFCMVDPDEPDTHTFPNFRSASPVKVLVQAGEALYLPASWFHQVKTWHPSRAVNHWFSPSWEPENAPSPPQDFL